MVRSVSGVGLQKRTFTFWPQQHGNHAPSVPVVDRLEHPVVEIITEPVRLFYLGTSVAVCRPGDEMKLDVGKIIGGVGVFRVDESKTLHATHYGEGTATEDGVLHHRACTVSCS